MTPRTRARLAILSVLSLHSLSSCAPQPVRVVPTPTRAIAHVEPGIQDAPLRLRKARIRRHVIPPAPPAPASGSVDWIAIAACESGGDWSANTGNGYWGGLQFHPGTWFGNGGGPFGGRGPFPFSAAEQIAVAERVLASQGIGAWPYCGRFA